MTASTTTFPKHETYKPAWYITSAKGQVLGKLAARIAVTLLGKTRPTFISSVDNGDFVVVTDVEAVVVTGRKSQGKIYHFHTGYPGGLKDIPFERLHARHPDEIIRLAVRRMLPKTVIGSHMLKRLKLYRGAAHPHAAQGPTPL